MTAVNEDLRLELLRLFGQDQELLGDLEDAHTRESFRHAFNEWKERVVGSRRPAVFYHLAVHEVWASDADAPEIVQRYVTFRKHATRRLQDIVDQWGWPRRGLVGDEAASCAYFLFGHADTSNEWRRRQFPAITEAYQAGEMDPRPYAHLCDRIEACDGKPQAFGTIMGPGDEPGEARLYWPLAGTPQEVDERRASVGLPALEQDLALFRAGATIGPYMTPARSE